MRIDADNAADVIAGQDLVVDCSDTFATRYAVNAACCAAGVDLVEGGVVGLSRAGDGDPAGGERVLPLRVPGAAAAGPRRAAPKPASSARRPV